MDDVKIIERPAGGLDVECSERINNPLALCTAEVAALRAHFAAERVPGNVRLLVEKVREQHSQVATEAGGVAERVAKRNSEFDTMLAALAAEQPATQSTEHEAPRIRYGFTTWTEAAEFASSIVDNGHYTDASKALSAVLWRLGAKAADEQAQTWRPHIVKPEDRAAFMDGVRSVLNSPLAAEQPATPTPSTEQIAHIGELIEAAPIRVFRNGLAELKDPNTLVSAILAALVPPVSEQPTTAFPVDGAPMGGNPSDVTREQPTPLDPEPKECGRGPCYLIAGHTGECQPGPSIRARYEQGDE